jgi:hypothetical protein
VKPQPIREKLASQVASRTSLLAIAVAAAAWAHDADSIAVFLEPTAAQGLRETVTLSANALGQLAPIDADGDAIVTQKDLDARAQALVAGVWADMPLATTTPCTRTREAAHLNDGLVELEAYFACDFGELHQDFRWLRVLPANFRVTATSGATRSYAQGSLTSVSMPWPGAGATASSSVAEGVVRTFTLASLAMLAALGLAFRRWAFAARGLALFLVSLGVGALASTAYPVGEPVVWLLWAALCVALAWLRHQAPWWAPVVAGMASGLTNPALASLGVAVIAVPTLVAATALGRVLWRHRWGEQVSWGLAVLACFAAGLRLLT